MTNFPPLLPHGDLIEVLPSVFVVTGQMSVGEGDDMMCFSRNMTVVHDGDAITLINTVRLDDDGLAAIDALGPVKNVVRIGAHHGRDDAFYLDRFDADFWAMPGTELSRGEVISKPLVAGELGPCLNTSVFTFETTTQPEAILRMERHGGILITCDSLQNFNGPDGFFNETAIARMEQGRFFRPANIGPGWRNANDPKPDDFARLKQLEFRHVIGGHGDPCLDDAHAQFSETFAEFFGV